MTMLLAGGGVKPGIAGRNQQLSRLGGDVAQEIIA